MEINLNISLLNFLIENTHGLLMSPINGSIHSIYCMFKDRAKKYHAGKDLINEYDQFLKQLEIIVKLDKYALEKNDEVILFINHDNLTLILKQLNDSAVEDNTSTDLTPRTTTATTTTHESKIDLLNSLILSSSSSTTKYDELLGLLNYENAGFKLIKERISLTTEKKPFIDICEDISHSMQLTSKKQHHQAYPRDLVRCLENKIHFIPIIKSHTDLSLGDCSYLDTCHKSDTCRYVHYLKHVPEQLVIDKTHECDQFNSNIAFWEKIAPYTKNGAVSNISRETLDAQWINCDVRTFDFNILGKFAAVIADPAWNIHMNLPYGTCNDTELLNLPLSNIQDEGILLLWVTGRAIEIGKESLVKWGYDLKNELIWIKTNQLSRTICTGRTGHWLNHSKEHLLVGVKGNPSWLNKGVDVDVIVSATRETSRKPDELYDMVERLVGPHARKLEIFGRDHNLREGWFTIGNQLSGDNILEHDVLKRYNELSVKNK